MMLKKLTRENGEYFRILPSFFNTIIKLAEEKRDIKIVFRTFGSDLAEIIKEMNDFCTGNHPCYPDVKFDGTNDTLDLRFTDIKNQCGGLIRNND